MPVRELFHLMLIVDDFDAADRFYTELFAPRVMMAKSWSDLDKRWASIGLIGSDLSFELMEPSKADDDRSAPLPKFFRRFGEHLHSLAWYVDPDDFPGLIDGLRANGVRVVGPDGSPFGDGELTDIPSTIFTHGRDTCGQLEFQVFGTALADPRFAPGWSDAYWRDEHPLGVQRLSHVTVVVGDLDRARDLYAGPLGGRVVHEESDEGAARAYVLVGTNTMVELVHPTHHDSRWGRELAANGELPNAMTLLVRDLDAAARHVDTVGARVIDRSADAFAIDPSDTFGALVAFTTRRIPDDPRDAR